MFAVSRTYVSKHRQFDDNGKHIPGECKIGERSGLRKLMRAARRGKIPDERMVIIKTAMLGAGRNARKYLNAHVRGA